MPLLLAERRPNARTTKPATKAGCRWDRSGEEPSLAEMLFDPIVELVLKRDGLTRQDVMAVVQAARLRLVDREDRRVA